MFKWLKNLTTFLQIDFSIILLFIIYCRMTEPKIYAKISFSLKNFASKLTFTVIHSDCTGFEELFKPTKCIGLSKKNEFNY